MSEIEWRANWIWAGEPAPVNGYRIFQRTFFWPGDRAAPTAYISADSRYKLYVNGQQLAHGPAPSPLGRITVDPMTVTLLGGQWNTIVAIVNHVGVPVFSGYRNRGGLYFQMEEIVSDELWQCAKVQPWDASSNRLTVQQGHAEYYDARLEPAGLFGGDVRGDEWESARIVSGPANGPWPILELRDIPMPRIVHRDFDIRMIGFGNTGGAEGATVADRMTAEPLRPLTSGTVQRFPDSSTTAVITPEGADIYLTYDIGEETSGYLTIEFETHSAGAIVDIGYDEAQRDGAFPSGFRFTSPESELRYADRITLRDGISSFRSFAPRAFRYVRVVVRGASSPVTLRSLAVWESTYPVTRLGSFTCSDGRLTKIWEIGRRTLQLCMDDRFMDCPWRERAQWIGDARIEALGAALLFGDTKLHRRFIRQVGQSQYPDGHTDPVGPGEWDKFAPDTPIPGFTAIWIRSVCDYYDLTGDGAPLVELLPQVVKATAWLHSFADSSGLLVNAAGWDFTDWAPRMNQAAAGASAPLNFFFIDALRAAARITEVVGSDRPPDLPSAAKFTEWADGHAHLCAEAFWGHEHSLFVDSFADGKRGTQASQHVNSLAAWLGIGTPQQQRLAISHVLDNPNLTPIGSPYFSFYLLAALYRLGHHEEALAYIRRVWGRMLDMDATTWWENSDPLASQCHAWSIGPSIDLITENLGIRAAEPGFTMVEIAPHPVDLAWAKGIVPIPQGDVAVSWLRTETRFTLDVSVPVGVHIRPILPSRLTDTLLVDGEPVDEDSIVRRDDREAELCVMPGSGYRFEVVAGGL